MPITTRARTTASGHQVLEARFDGAITMEEARAYHRSILPGGPHADHGHLITGNVRAISSDVKQLLGSRRPDPHNPPPVAVVLDSVLSRMAAALIMRASSNVNTSTFATDAEALAWLDERMAEYHRRRLASTG